MVEDIPVTELNVDDPALLGSILSPGAVALLANMIQTGQWYDYSLKLKTDADGRVWLTDQRLFEVAIPFRPRVLWARANRERRTSPPERKSLEAAGWDMRICLESEQDELDILPHDPLDLPTGWHVQIPHGYVGLLVLRSGMRHTGLKVANQVGVIDADYRGEVVLCLENTTDFPIRLKHNERYAQLVVVEAGYRMSSDIISLEELTQTERGANGLGHTGRG